MINIKAIIRDPHLDSNTTVDLQAKSRSEDHFWEAWKESGLWDTYCNIKLIKIL